MAFLRADKDRAKGLPDGLDWLSYLACSSKSHHGISIACIFLQSPHQVGTENFVACKKDNCQDTQKWSHVDNRTNFVKSWPVISCQETKWIQLQKTDVKNRNNWQCVLHKYVLPWSRLPDLRLMMDEIQLRSIWKVKLAFKIDWTSHKYNPPFKMNLRDIVSEYEM